jgi:hypothetical protein
MDGIDIMFILINSWNISYKLLCMGLVEFSNMIWILKAVIVPVVIKDEYWSKIFCYAWSMNISFENVLKIRKVMILCLFWLIVGRYTISYFIK